MKGSISIIFFSMFLTGGLFAQAAKVRPVADSVPAVAANSLTSEKMYVEANDYAKKKFAEFNEKKIAFNEALRLKTLSEQKQLAARFAATIAAWKEVKDEDLYYWGMLHWIAENRDGAEEILKKFLAAENPAAEKAQTARGVVVMAAARRKNFADAERFLADYLANTPVRTRERSEMSNELSLAYLAAKEYAKAMKHAEEAYHLVKTLFSEQSSRARALAEILDRGQNVFEIYKQSGDSEKADAVLEDLRKVAAAVESNGIYYFAVDNQVRYLIETDRKPQALKLAEELKTQIEKDFANNKPLQSELISRFRKREKHYRLLGETAPELVEIHSWLPGESKFLSSLRGKVVVLDFWATWCGPCFEAFPKLRELHQTYQKDGLEILGVTRFYGNADGAEVNETGEINFLLQFKEKQRLPYSFVVAQNNTNQIIYGAGALPTAVIIDRRGTIRYIETGTNPSRNDEIETMVEKLLAEK